MNKIERMRMVKAMEYIVRQINNEGIFYRWLSVGVADGDIEYGDLEVGLLHLDEDNAYWYTDDDTFKDLMSTFLRLMTAAYNGGGLYCDGVVSRERIKER